MRPRLGLCLIVRDEEDILERNILHHLSHGFDQIAVMDNGSKDETPAILERLAKHHPLTIVNQPSTDYRQDEWATQLAMLLAEAGIDWAISLDADEFLTLGEEDRERIDTGEITWPAAVPRHNVLPGTENLDAVTFDQLAALFRVVKPLGSVTRTGPDTDPEFPMMLRTFPGKLLFPTAGLRSVFRGCHQVAHTAETRGECPGSLIRHFPVRSRKKFLDKLDQAEQRFAQEKGVGASTSWHIRRWVRQRANGKFEGEYASYFLSATEQIAFLKDGTIVEDSFGPMIGYRTRTATPLG